MGESAEGKGPMQPPTTEQDRFGMIVWGVEARNGLPHSRVLTISTGITWGDGRAVWDVRKSAEGRDLGRYIRETRSPRPS